METGTITAKTVINWVIGSVPLLLFYLEYRRNKKQSSKKLGELEKMLIKEIVERKDLERKIVEDKLEKVSFFYSQIEKRSEKQEKEIERLTNINSKLRKKLIRSGVGLEEIDRDDTSFEKWDQEWERREKQKKEKS